MTCVNKNKDVRNESSLIGPALFPALLPALFSETAQTHPASTLLRDRADTPKQHQSLSSEFKGETIAHYAIDSDIKSFLKKKTSITTESRSKSTGKLGLRAR